MTSPEQSRKDANAQLTRDAKRAGGAMLQGAGHALALLTDPADELKAMGRTLSEGVRSKDYAERVEALATRKCVAAASAHPKLRAGRQVNKQSLHQLIQELTLKAVEARVEDRIRAIVAASIGATEDGPMASAADLYAAETILQSKDHQIAFFREWLNKWIGPKCLNNVVPCPHAQLVGPYPLQAVCDDNMRNQMVSASRGYFPVPLDHPTNIYVETFVFGLKTSMEMTRQDLHDKNHPFGHGVWWPSELTQRIHNALVRARENIEFELNLE
ncbi:MAG: hypothetical protein IPP14_11515 [Planctomycetes bacterium]|nr:hypothetical protein [Planctomycetota bacterium]